MSIKTNQICYLCGNQIEGKTTYDHVPPKQFYPKEIRENVDMNLQLAPSHEQCNNSYKDDEEYFYASLYPIVKKNNPSMAKLIFRDFARRCRQPQMPAVLREIFSEASQTTQGGIKLPNGIVEINLDLYKLERIACKIARGILYLYEDIFIPEVNIVDIRICSEVNEVPEMYQISWKIDRNIKGALLDVFSFKYIEYKGHYIITMDFWKTLKFCITVRFNED